MYYIIIYVNIIHKNSNHGIETLYTLLILNQTLSFNHINTAGTYNPLEGTPPPSKQPVYEKPLAGGSLSGGSHTIPTRDKGLAGAFWQGDRSHRPLNYSPALGFYLRAWSRISALQHTHIVTEISTSLKEP